VSSTTAARRRATKRSTEERRAYLGLGSNVGDRRAHLSTALTLLARHAPILRVSSVWKTDPVGFTDQPHFWNLVAAVSWRGSASALLDLCQRIERRVGRRRTFPNGPREIDVDILDLAGIVRARPDPVLPHPRLSGRRFALAPLAEIAPRWRHPVSGRRARELLRGLPRKPGAKRLRVAVVGRR
jgi:2-amino-4-hydroxy-6-hydroxymethyldihydropteridine diphosphokinase